MTSGIKKVILNKKKTSAKGLKQVVYALSSKTILAEKGGFLFKVFIENDELHFGIVPYFINGHRTHHYEVQVVDNKYTLSGFINSNESISLLIKLTPEEFKNGLTQEDKMIFYETYQRFALFLVEHGYPENTELDKVSQLLLNELEILPRIPTTISELGHLVLGTE